MPTGWDNECEHDGKTKPEVLHSEANAILKVARSTDSTVGASIFCSHTPCIECAKLIYQSGITHVYTRFEYDSAKGCGQKFLEESGIPVEMISPVD
jgi:dCMP deaminase